MGAASVLGFDTEAEDAILIVVAVDFAVLIALEKY